MSIRTLDLEQGSPEWREARRGIITASIVGQLVTARRPTAADVDCPDCGALAGDPCIGKRSPEPIKTMHQQRADAARRDSRTIVSRASDADTRPIVTALAAERLIDWDEEQYESRDMLRGHLDEPLARAHYSKHHAPVDEVGFIVRDDWGFPIGCSPDGLVADDGGIEAKSRAPKKHLATIVSGKVPAENMAQVQTCLLVTGRSWWDYISWCGGLPMWVKRVTPDPAWQTAIVDAVQAAEIAIRDILATYHERVAGLPATEHVDHFGSMEIVL